MTGDTRDEGPRQEGEAIEAVCRLVEGARQGASNLTELLDTALGGDPFATHETLARSGPVAVSGQDFLFLLETQRPAAVAIDDQPPVPMTPILGTGYAARLETLRLGTTHNFLWHVGGHVLGGMGGTMPRSVAGYSPGSYPIPDAPRGTLSETRTITSRIYGGATSRYWVYTNPGIDTERGAPIMVWLDGQNHVGLMDVFGTRMQTVTDNLVHRHLIPPMVHVLIEPSTGGSLAPTTTPPGTTPDTELRSIQYDTVNDDLGRYLVEEVLPEVEQTVSCARTATRARSPASRPAGSPRSTSAGTARSSSAAPTRRSAASPRYSGTRNGTSTAATSSRS